MPPTKYYRPATPRMVALLRAIAAHQRGPVGIRTVALWCLAEGMGAKMQDLTGLRLRGYVARDHVDDWVIYTVTDAGHAFLTTLPSA